MGEDGLQIDGGSHEGLPLHIPHLDFLGADGEDEVPIGTEYDLSDVVMPQGGSFCFAGEAVPDANGVVADGIRTGF